VSAGQPVFETPRARVRAWASGEAGEADARAFFELSRDYGLSANTIVGDPSRYRPASLGDAGARIVAWREYFADTGLGIWPVHARASSAMIGLCGIKPIRPDGDVAPGWEMMYRLATPHWGQGLAGEIAFGLLLYGFERRKLDRITAGVLADNGASIRVAEKSGLTYEREIAIEGSGARLYSITAEEFAGLRQG
jgi:RimJ/RimL family protein N-acetyltransferase